MAAPNAVPVAAKKKSQVSAPMIYLLLIVVGAAIYLNLPNPNAAGSTAKKHKTTTVSSTGGADANGITAADYKAHFPRYPGTGRNPFVPGILTASQQNASASSLLGGKGVGAGGSWSLTGVTVIDGTASALIESSAGDSVTLKKGDQWHGLRVAGISSDAVSFTNDFGQSTQISFNSDSAGKGANPNAPSVPSLSQIQPLPALNVAAQANTGSAIITGLPAVTPLGGGARSRRSGGGSAAASGASVSQNTGGTVTTVITDRPS